MASTRKKRSSSSSSGTAIPFTESLIYKIITTTSAENVAKELKQALFVQYHDVNQVCPQTGRTFLHVVVEHHVKFSDPRALPAVYQLCYAGIDVSAQENEKGESVLHQLVKLPGSYRLIVAVMRYGIDITLKNNEGQTAEQILESSKFDISKENVVWYKKFAPGLHCTIYCTSVGLYCAINYPTSSEISPAVVEHLLKAWCRVCIFDKGKPCDLLQVSQNRAKDALLAEMIKKYYWTNELVHATLAGLPEEMKRIYKEAKKKINVDTVDHSYQLNLDSPEVQQPLIAAAWEQCNFDVVDQLMLMDADVCVTYSNESVADNPLRPLFYQTLLGKPQVKDLNIMLRILEGGDLRCKTESSTTFLHECVKHSLPPEFMAKLFELDVPLEERELMGYTARDLAASKGQKELVQVLDDVVLEFVQASDIKRLESLVLQCYDLSVVTSSSGRTLFGMADNAQLPNKVTRFLKQTIPTLEKQMKELWSSVDKGDMVKLQHYLNSKDKKSIIYSRNRCGRTILLTAIINKNKEAIKLIIKKHPKLVEYFDNNMMTCLHYAFLFFEEDKEISTLLQSAGASLDWCCTGGRSAYFYQKGIISDKDFYATQAFVRDYGLTVFVNKTTFEPKLVKACKEGDLEELKQLVDQIQPYGCINMFKHVMFDAIDAKQDDVVQYLISEGCATNATKQYEQCKPDNEMCAMMECFHPKTTLYARAKQMGLDDLAQKLQLINIGKS